MIYLVFHYSSLKPGVYHLFTFLDVDVNVIIALESRLFLKSWS